MRHARRKSRVPSIESLESRVLLNAALFAARNHARATLEPTFQLFHPTGLSSNGSSSPSGGISPAQMVQAYGVNAINFGSVTGTGAGQTIALIDAYNDPKAASDLAAFDSYYGLAAPPSFTQLNQSGGTSLPANASVGGWGLEESLDIEWAHVIAPQAKIILYEASSNSDSDLISAAATTARNNANVTVVSMSFGGGEDSSETSLDSVFTSSHVTFVASTGDTGSPAGYPSYSPNVIAVGGTTLSVSSSGTWMGETAWSGSGGGTSTVEAEPAYQQSVQTTGSRTTPDVAMDANPGSGVPVYDSYDEGTSAPWITVGGTSLASPMFAGLIAIADQGRVINGLSVLNTKSNPAASNTTQALPLLYTASQSDFHDVTSGSNGGYSAGPGYDEVTGRGSPIANQLVPYLAGTTPTVTSFSASPDPVASGSNFVLSATVTDPDSTVTGVAFYQESNGTAGLQTGTGGDTYLGAGTLSSGQWSLTVSSTGLSGTIMYYALPTDASGVTGSAGLTTETIASGQPSNASFEAPSVGSGSFSDYQYNPAGASWTFTGDAGVSGNGSGFTQNNPNAPQGTQVAFLQMANSSISQSLTISAGTYTLSFESAQRVAYQSGQQNFEVLVDGNVVGQFTPMGSSYVTYSTAPFTVAPGSHTIQFLGLDTAGGDNTVFIDGVQIAATTIASGEPADSGFEAPSIGSGNFGDYQYNPSGTPWQFAGYAGISGNDSGFTQSNPDAPEGTQVAFLQFANSSISQSVSLSAGTYVVSFSAAQRVAYQSGQQNFEVLVDGNIVGQFTPNGANYAVYATNSFTVTAGTHAIEFLSLDSAGGDETAFIDNVQVTAPNFPSVSDAGFESPAVGSGGNTNFAYDPAGTAWTFAGNSGVTGNGTGFTGRNPNAPEGTQVAFLQMSGSSIAQSVSMAAGTYAVDFFAAQRVAYQSSQQNFEVLVDGNVVGQFTPGGSDYASYSTAAFTVAAGTHTISFVGLDTAGGDNTAFIDDVQVMPV